MENQHSEISDVCYKNYCVLIHDLTGIHLRENRQDMLVGRLRKRLRALDLKYEEYLEKVRKDASEQVVFVDLVTTNETYFYRTPRVWEHFKNVFLPEWFAANPGKEFRAWSAAASSGEEAHTLAIHCEEFKSKHPGFRYSITGTDISREMVELCEQGIYSGRSIQIFRTQHAELFNKYMQNDGAGFKAITEVRSRLKFVQHNLFEALVGQGSFDYVLLRNVLIYFTNSDQEKVLARVRAKMNDTSVLVIGESESLTQLNTSFEFISPLIYRSGKEVKAAA